MTIWCAHNPTRWHIITYSTKYVHFNWQLLGCADYAKHHHSCLAGQDFCFPSQDHCGWYIWACKTAGLRDGPNQGGKGGTRQEKAKEVHYHQKFWYKVGFGKGEILLYAGVGLEGQACLPVNLWAPWYHSFGVFIWLDMHMAWKQHQRLVMDPEIFGFLIHRHWI